MVMTKKSLLIIALAIILFIVAIGIIYFSSIRKETTGDNANTEHEKIEDGTETESETPEDESVNAEEIIEKIRTTNYPVSLMQAEQDDKTILGLINIDLAFDDKDAVFYAEPDWNALQDAWNRKAYPHLYAEKQDDTANVLTNDTESETGSGRITENAGTVSEVGSSGGEDPGEVTENKKNTHDADSVDDVLLIFEKKDSSDAVDDTVKPVDSSKKAATKKKPQPNASMPSEAPLPARPKHEKPKRKGLIGKIGDLFD